eukprot:4145054-Amphidinium_carterae.6
MEKRGISRRISAFSSSMANGKPQPVAPEVLEMYEKRIRERQAQAKAKASMITADGSVSIANVKSCAFTDEVFCLYDTRANCMVLPNGPEFKGSPIKCTLPGETVVEGQVIQVLSMKNNDAKVKVVALQGAAPIMPMAILVDMAGWKIEITDTIPALMVATDQQGKRRSLSRVDGLHYLCHEDFMACLTDAYKKVDVLGRVHQSALKKYVRGLKSKDKGLLGSLAEAEELSSGSTFADEGRSSNGARKGEKLRTNLIRVPKETVLDPSNIDRTRIALSKPTGNTGELFKKIAFLTEIHAKQHNRRFARSGIANKGVAIQMGAKTGRGTGFDVEHQYVLKNTLEEDKTELLEAVHALARTHVSQISYTSVVVTKLEAGQMLNPHVDNKNHGNIRNHTICFGEYEGGQLQVERLNKNGVLEWQLVGLTKMWVSSYAGSMMHRVSEVTTGARYSVTFYTPGNLGMVPEGDWDYLRKAGFPIDEVCARLQFFGMELLQGAKVPGRPVDTTDTSSTSGQKPVSFVPAVSSLETQESENKGSEEVLSPLDPLGKLLREGCYLCGESKGGTTCSICEKLACSQHIRVRIDQQQQKALPVCRSCSLLDESSRHTGLETLPLNINELTEGIKALDCLCSSTFVLRMEDQLNRIKR